IWSAPDGSARFDVMPASAWPPYYPPLSGVVERARPGRQPLPVASEEDRLLILAADAVTGRPVEKLTRRMRSLLEAPGVSGRLEAVARAVVERLAESGRPSETAWARLGVEELRDRVSGPIKRLLRYRGTVADPVASSPAAERPPDAGARAGRRSLVAWIWIPVVAGI